MEIQDIAKFLINPLIYGLLGIILLIFIKKHRLKLTLLLIVYFYLISITFTGNIFSKVWKINDTFKPKIIYDAVIVLAGVSDADWHLDRDGLPFIPHDFFVANKSIDRLLAGIYFVKSRNAKLLLIGDWVSGKYKQGMYKTYDEGIFVKKLVTEMGLRENQIQIYGKIKRTLDEAEGVKKYITSHQVGNFLLVTSELHMRRALAMFKKLRLNPDTFSVCKEDMEITWESFIPQVKGIIKTEDCLFAFVAYIGYYLRGNL
jgi:uncharacterized SAM-binding protein YcdF (DUF218 family)